MIQPVKVNDKEFPFLYSLSAAMESEKRNIKGLDAIEITCMHLYLGFKYGSKFEDSKFPYSEKEFRKMVELNPVILTDASKVFEEQVGKLTGEVAAKLQA